MVNKGWDHGQLNAMSEDEFVALFEDQLEFDSARNEAEKEAIRKAGRK